MEETGIFDYCKNVCKGKCCIPHCQEFDYCDNDLCVSYTCSKVREILNLSEEQKEYCIKIKIETRKKYREKYKTRNPYFLNVKHLILSKEEEK